MKKLLFIILILSSDVLLAQESENEKWSHAAQQPHANFYQIRQKMEKEFSEKKKGSRVTITSQSDNVQIVGENDYVKYRRWEWYQSQHVKPDGSFPTSGELQQEFEKFHSSQATGSANARMVASAAEAQWVNLSRTSNSGGYWGMGRSCSAAFHPTNANTFWVTAPKGGVWKTTDGGKSYIPQGDNLPYVAAGAIVVDYSNPTVLYVCTGENNGDSGLGIYKSTDGGSSWTATGFTRNLDTRVSFFNLVQSPSAAQTLLVATSQGLYRTTDGGSTWTQIKAGRCTDVEYKLNDGNVAYAMIDRTFYKSTDGGVTFAVTGAPMVPNNGLSRIALTKANYSCILMWSRGGIWVSSDGGSTWSEKTLPKDQHSNPVNNSVGMETMVISPTNANTLYGGEVDFFKSTDNGATWSKIGRWCCNGADGVKEVHADHRHSAYHPLTNEIFSFNDGGVDTYNESTSTWTQLSNGLVIPQYYSAASAATNANIIGVGSQDNGGSRRQNSLVWINTNGGDAGTQAIDPANASISYSNYNPSPAIIRTTDNWATTQNVRPADNPLTSWWVIPFMLDPNNDSSIVVGYHAIYRSNNRGNTWSKISPDFAPAGDYWQAFRSIAMAPSNSNYIYAGRARNFYYTTNNGGSWGNVAFNQADISDICVHPTAPKTVWLTMSQFSAENKVFKSTDGGVTWTNMSNGLPNIPVLTIVYQDNSNDLLYIGTDFGVYYRDASMSSWARYGTGLPACSVNDLHIHYGAQKLRAATYGRGVYETDLLTSSSTNPVCAAPTGVRATPASTSVNLSWNAVPASSSYYIYYKRTADASWTAGPSSLTNPSVQLTGLTATTAYDVDVWVVCTNGSYLSTRINFTTTSSSGLISEGIYEIKSGLDNRRNLDVSRAGTTAGSNVHIWDDVNGVNQRWKLVDAGNGYYNLIPQNATTKALDVNASTNANGTNVQIWDVYNNAAQRWKITSVGGIYYKLQPECALTRCLDVSGARDANGSNVQIWDDLGSNAQKWSFELIQAPSLAPPVSPIAAGAAEGLTEPHAFPNPALDKITIQYQAKAKVETLRITMVDALGRVVYDQQKEAYAGSNTMEVSTSKLAIGMYSLILYGGKNKVIHSQKILIRN